MTINDFAKKYGVDKRSVDYWTSLGLLHPETNAKNRYRLYGDKAEEEIKSILIAVAINGTNLEDTVAFVRGMPKSCWNKFIIPLIKAEMEKQTKFFQNVLKYAEQMGEGD